MPEGAWRPGMATACGKCGSRSLTYSEDGAALCAACGAVTPPVWARRTAPPPTPGPAAAGEPVPTLRFVSPPPSSAPAPPPTAFQAPPAGVGAGMDLRQRRILAGGFLLLFGVAVTLGTYELAASNPGGGTYFIAFGPALFGIYLIVKGLATPVGIPALNRTRRKARAVPVPAVPKYVPPTDRRFEPARGTSHTTRWPLWVFLIGLVLLIVGEAISLMNSTAIETVADAVAFPGFFLMIAAPIWWIGAKVRERFRRAPV